ncbi:MAG: hypothetical protein AB7V62_07530 [Thermoleophilia bacterium]
MSHPRDIVPLVMVAAIVVLIVVLIVLKNRANRRRADEARARGEDPWSD